MTPELRPTRRQAGFCPLLLLALLWVFPAAAGTVDVRVLDRDGGAVQRIRIRLEAIDLPSQSPSRRFPLRSGETNASGQVRFENVVPGQYEVTARTYGTDLVSPEDNPLAPPVRLTLDHPDGAVEVELELHRGTPLCTRFTADRSWRELYATVKLREIETRYTTRHRLLQDEEKCVPLFAGRWKATLDPPAGYLLIDVEINGRSTEGRGGTFDLRPGDLTHFISWHFVAPARLSGEVTFESDTFTVRVQADLLQAGPWLEAAERRGGSDYGSVLAGVDLLTGAYTMDLPDGVWLVRPVGDGLEGSEPEEAEVVLAAGEELRRDFRVRGAGEGTASLAVYVSKPNGRRSDEAVVEIWPLDPALRGEEPLGRDTAVRWRPARFRDLPEGSYLAVAGDPDHREGRLEIPSFDPEKKRSYQLRLRQAAELRVHTRDAGGLSAVGAEIRLERLNDAPDMILTEPGLVEAAKHPRGEVDVTREAWVRGIYAGRYRITAHLENAFLRFRDGDRWVEEVELHFSDRQKRELEATVLPAASIRGTVFCRGGEPLPSNLDLRILPSEARPEDPLDGSWTEHVVLDGNDVPLKGRYHDAFELGPLDVSSYILALRPASFDRWTWSYGTEDGEAAGSFETTDGEVLDLGAISVECGPAVRVVLRVENGPADADLREVTPRRGNFEISGSVTTPEDQRHEIERVDVEAYRRVLLLRGFPEGRAELLIRLGHPYFLPDYWIEVAVVDELQRGRTVDATATAVDLGGALSLTDPTGMANAARVGDGANPPRLQTLSEGRVSFFTLPAGVVTVDLCADAACATVVRSFGDVVVERLATTRLP